VSLLFTLAAWAAPLEDSAADSWMTPNNPSAGALGDWSYGYLSGPTFATLPTVVSNAFTKIDYWDLSGAKPRVSKNVGTADKTSGGVFYPVVDYLVLNAKVAKPVAVRFTAAAGGTYSFDTTFQAARTVNSASATVSVQKDGAVVGGCSGSVSGLWNSASGNVLSCPGVQVTLAAGESVDFVVDAGAADAYDDVALKVIVSSSTSDSDNDGLSDADEDTWGTDPNVADSDLDGLDDGPEVYTYLTDPTDPDTDADGLEDGEEVHTYLTDPLDSDTDGGGVSDGLEVSSGTDPLDPSDDAYGDSLFDSFVTPANPGQGTLGQWSYGYFASGNYTLLPNLVVNTWSKLSYWELTGGKPRITKNVGTADKISGGVIYPVADYLVVHPKVGHTATVRFTADATGDYQFSATFKAARTIYSASATVSMQQSGAVVGGCSGSVTGQWSSASGNLVVCSGVQLSLAAGETVDFVVESGSKDNYDNVAVKVLVSGGADPSSDTDGDGLTFAEEQILGTDPDLADTDSDTLEDGDEVAAYDTDPTLSDTDGDGLHDGNEVIWYSSDPLSADTDLDGLSDGDEVNVYGTDPTDYDSDLDGIDDGVEVANGTDPLVAD
jgi:hypothetical protein